jgi:hypothetical protein
VALEQSRGPLVFALTKYDHLVIFPVHPTTLVNYRKSFRPSGAKDDPSDARLLLDTGPKRPSSRRQNATLPELYRPSHGRHQIPHPHEVVGGRCKGKNPPDCFQPAMPRLAERANCFHPAKVFFDAFPFSLAHLIACMSPPKPDRTRIQQLAVAAIVPLRHVKTSNPCCHSSSPLLPPPASSSRAAPTWLSKSSLFASKWPS